MEIYYTTQVQKIIDVPKNLGDQIISMFNNGEIKTIDELLEKFPSLEYQVIEQDDEDIRIYDGYSQIRISNGN